MIVGSLACHDNRRIALIISRVNALGAVALSNKRSAFTGGFSG
jgi:hypothetical protein